MIEDQQRGGGAPYGALLLVVVAVVMVVPALVGDQEALTGFVEELLSPLGLLLLPIGLLLVIQFLSSAQGSVLAGIFSTDEPDSIHRVSGSPVGVALFLFLVLFLLYNRFSIFGGGEDAE